ncbi:MAG: hypothetical protein KKH83_05140 [Candidatus Margulisbacteria bacterium]|nr:hypothetical protein [Candidatus Margulisiibacteriota bacterium]
MKGKIEKIFGSPGPHSYFIKGDDGNSYFAHLGDIEDNEKKLYQIPGITYLDVNNDVEFEPIKEHRPRAIKVRKVK